MGLISPAQVQDGTTSVNAAAVNNPINTIANEFNGNIDDANIKPGAAIAGSKVNIASFSNPYKFSVYRGSAWTAASGYGKVQFDTENFDTGSNFDSTTNYRFTAPVAGFYMFCAAAESSITGSNFVGIALYVNGSKVKENFWVNGSTTTTSGAHISALLQLSTSDYVEVYHRGTGGAGVATNSATWFTGHFVSAT